VDVYVPGCAARPEAIIDGVVKALGVLEQKQSGKVPGPAAPIPVPAEPQKEVA
jgi:Ni,Fe-hydrogenase III small subunit